MGLIDGDAAGDGGDGSLHAIAREVLEHYRRLHLSFANVDREMDEIEAQQETLVRSLSPDMAETEIVAIVGEIGRVKEQFFELRETWLEARHALEMIQEIAGQVLNRMETLLLTRGRTTLH